MKNKINTFGIDEKIEKFICKNGLTVYFLENKLINRTYVNIKTKYGSIDQEFKYQNKLYQTPAGIAHFLEHKLFEMKNHQDAAVLLSELGADPNAYTTNTMTSYLFSTTSHVEECLKILLEFVFNSNFNKKSIEREVEIIEQELNMYDDEPDIILVKKLLENMYQKNHVRFDIGGSKESIRKINKDLLDKCYDLFYNPENMVLFVAGNFDREKVLEIIFKYESRENKIDQTELERIYYIEDEKVLKNYEAIEVASGIEKICIGHKLNGNNQLLVKEMIAIKVLNNLLFGSSSDFYESMLKKQVITENFSSYATFEKSFAHFIIETDSKKAGKFITEIKKYFKNLKSIKISEEDFHRIKNAYLGSFIFSLSNIENFVNSFLKYENIDINFFENYQAIVELSLEDVEKVKAYFSVENLAIVKGLPKKA